MIKTIPVKRALISVSDKTDVIDFAKDLIRLGVEIISTGGTSKALQEAGIQHQQVEDITSFPEMLDGRVKTLHPKVHGGILGKRDKHAQEAAQHGIGWIDLVVVNFYPFVEALKHKKLDWQEAVEYIDIGGPTMVRAAAKNFAWVGVVVDPSDYANVIAELTTEQGLKWETRRYLAEKVFGLTARYDAAIHQYFATHEQQTTPAQLNLHLEKAMDLRYGENPHQQASAYQFSELKTGVLAAKQHQGKPLSFNNILDAESALACVSEFTEPACVIVKHANPCGVAASQDINDAYQQAYQADSLSAFGGIVALNRPCTETIAHAITQIFMEVVLAPAFTPEALAILQTKPNLRVLEFNNQQPSTWEMKFISGGMLLQQKDLQQITKDVLTVVTHVQPTDAAMDSMLFAWKVLKHIKSNGILLANDHVTLGIGAGQVSRVDAVDLALRKAGDKMKGSILASDAFFPFRDSIDKLAHTGIQAIIQPGGSVRDEEVIAACNEHGIAMVFTGKRCFKH